ncbi:hypothetical protein GCM10020331_007100 [Ectobacillus funiculus]
MPIEETNPDHLVKLMVGREPKDIFQRQLNGSVEIAAKVPVLEVKGLSDNKVIDKINLQVYPGEVVGLAGLVGAGRTELVRTIFGSVANKSGDILINGQQVDIASHRDAIEKWYCPCTRKQKGTRIVSRFVCQREYSNDNDAKV